MKCGYLLMGIFMSLYGADMNERVTQQDLNYWQAEAMRLPWFTKWTEVLTTNGPVAHWFVGGMLNASYACLDIHVQNGRAEHPAIYWTNERGDSRSITYGQLYNDVNSFASYLRSSGVGFGDRVVIYMPMIPEALVAMLACARLGAIHVVVFSGFSAQALRDRIIDTGASVVISSDYSYYRGRQINLKQIVDEALNDDVCSSVIIIKRTDNQVPCLRGRDRVYERQHGNNAIIDPVPVASDHPLFILYTSGTTGKPKGIVHSTGGYLTYVFSTIKTAFGIDKTSVYWCTADFGWITGHSYGVYGPLMHGATLVMREGAPDYPDSSAWWQVIDRYKVSIFYTSPTALRMFMRLGPDILQGADLRSLQVLGSVGEPINPEVWLWYYKQIGKGFCPIIDTWWQTETGGFMIAPRVSMVHEQLKPGSATLPMPSIDACVVDKDGNQVGSDIKGFLVIKKPWPGMSIGIYNDQELFKEIYWSRFPGAYYTGDYALCDKDGYFWLLGRADEVIKVSGHRIGTAEIESAVLQHEAVAETAAIGVNDSIKGEAIVLFVALKNGFSWTPECRSQIIQGVRGTIGSFATPKEVYCIEKLPKNRSGKIMRRLLKAILEKGATGDLSTLEEGVSVAEIQQIVQSVATLY